MDADQIAMTLMDAGQRAGGRPEAVSDYLRRGFDAFPLDAPIEQVSPWVGTQARSAAPVQCATVGGPSTGLADPARAPVLEC